MSESIVEANHRKLAAFLSRLVKGEDLSHREAAELIHSLRHGNATDAQVAAVLIALTTKGETVDELCGMASAVRETCMPLRPGHGRPIDINGTGASRSRTFNVSTAAAFVIAGAGQRVAKTADVSTRGRSGAADVLTQLGVDLTATAQITESALYEAGICFLNPRHYRCETPRISAVRRQLRIPTVLNLITVLANPANVKRQITGVWHPSQLKPIARSLARMGSERAWVVYGLDGLDEITLADKTLVAEVAESDVRTFEVSPSDFGLTPGSIDHLRDANADANAQIIRSVLNGQRRDEARSLVVINAAAGLFVGGRCADLKAAVGLAQKSIDSGAAQNALDRVVRITQR